MSRCASERACPLATVRGANELQNGRPWKRREGPSCQGANDPLVTPASPPHYDDRRLRIITWRSLLRATVLKLGSSLLVAKGFIMVTCATSLCCVPLSMLTPSVSIPPPVPAMRPLVTHSRPVPFQFRIAGIRTTQCTRDRSPELSRGSVKPAHNIEERE
jgi:hypothetical protein